MSDASLAVAKINNCITVPRALLFTVAYRYGAALLCSLLAHCCDSTLGWDHIVSALLRLGFSLLEHKKRDNASLLAATVGRALLCALFASHELVQSTIMCAAAALARRVAGFTPGQLAAHNATDDGRRQCAAVRALVGAADVSRARREASMSVS